MNTEKKPKKNSCSQSKPKTVVQNINNGEDRQVSKIENRNGNKDQPENQMRRKLLTRPIIVINRRI